MFDVVFKVFLFCIIYVTSAGGRQKDESIRSHSADVKPESEKTEVHKQQWLDNRTYGSVQTEKAGHVLVSWGKRVVQRKIPGKTEAVRADSRFTWKEGR